MSEATGAPVYIVHLAAKRALDVATEARSRGVPIFVETRPVYLHYTADVYQQEDAALYLGVPPIRPQRDQDALWERDRHWNRPRRRHRPCAVHQRAQARSLTKSGAGQFPGRHAESSGVHADALLGRGRQKRITIERFVQVTASNPAKLFGLYPRKGVLAVGSDADLALWDPNETRTIRDEDMLSGAGFSVYAGWEVTGWPLITIRRGEVVYEDRNVISEPGTGKLLERRKWNNPTLP